MAAGIRSSRQTPRLALLMTALVAVAMAVVSPHAVRADDLQYSSGRAHVEWAPHGGGRGGSIDLPLVPTYPLGDPAADWKTFAADPLEACNPQATACGPHGAWPDDPADFATRWDARWADGVAYQMLFGDTNVTRPAPMLAVWGWKTGNVDRWSYDEGFEVRLPGDPSCCPHAASGAGCTMTITGSAQSEVDGTVSCVNIDRVLQDPSDTNAPMDLQATFALYPPGAAPGPLGPLTGAGGPPVGPVVVIGGGVVGVGGVVVWRRRRRRTGPPRQASPTPIPVAPGVPANCRSIAQQLDKTTAELATLHEALDDLTRQLQRAELIQRNNLAKARLVVNLEIGRAVAATATDVALALRPGVLRRAATDGIGEMDTWKPPVNLDPRVASVIESLTTAFTGAAQRVSTIASELGEMTAGVEQAVSEVPAVAAQRDVVAQASSILEQEIADLGVCTPLRSQIADLDAESPGVGQRLASLWDTERPLKRELDQLQSELNVARNNLSVHQRLTPRDLAAAEKELADLHAQGIEDTARLGAAKDRVDELRMELADLMRPPDAQSAAQQVSQLEAKVAQAKANLDFVQQQISEAEQHATAISDQRQALTQQILDHHDVYPGDIDAQKQILAAAQQREADLANAARQQLSGNLARKQAELEQAQLAALQAKAALQEAQDEATEAARKAAAQAATGAASGWGFPFTLVKEIVFGVGQSPEEIIEILRSGAENIRLMRAQLATIQRLVVQHEARQTILSSQLANCVVANGGSPGGTPVLGSPDGRPAGPPAPIGVG